jgi:hypothetical protein
VPVSLKSNDLHRISGWRSCETQSRTTLSYCYCVCSLCTGNVFAELEMAMVHSGRGMTLCSSSEQCCHLGIVEKAVFFGHFNAKWCQQHRGKECTDYVATMVMEGWEKWNTGGGEGSCSIAVFSVAVIYPERVLGGLDGWTGEWRCVDRQRSKAVGKLLKWLHQGSLWFCHETGPADMWPSVRGPLSLE